jgi:peptide/nickel transport system ATP-binding protein
MTLKPFLEVKNLNVAFPTEDGLVQASNDISFTVARGETLAVVGESGSGKS